MMVGADNAEGEESFDLTLCTVDWVRRQIEGDQLFDGRHHLIFESFDFDVFERFLKRRVAECRGDSWSEVAAKLSLIGRWEFENYSESSAPEASPK